MIKVAKKTKNKSDIIPGGVDNYISKCPQELRDRLNEIRIVILEAAPNSIETVSYFQIPGYCYEGYDYNGMFAWFSFKEHDVRLHVRPPVIENHKDELSQYKITKAIVSFPANEKLPSKLVKKLVKASIKIMKDKK